MNHRKQTEHVVSEIID